LITAAPESFTQVLPELKGLVHGHWEKLAIDKDTIPLDPRYDIYLERDRRGEVLFMTLRDAGRLVGYWVGFVNPGLHYGTCLTHIMDIWNVLPEYEMTTAPLTLMRALERELKRRGVQRSIVIEKLHRPCGRLFTLFKYEPVEMVYSKLIGA
jgi:hypothetical protein